MAEDFTHRFFESLHRAEFERKDKHDAADSFLLAALSVLGSVGIYFFRVLPFHSGVWEVIFWQFTIVYLALVGVATYCVAWSVWPRWIAYLSPPGELGTFADGLRAHYEAVKSKESKVTKAVDADMMKLAASQYVECADRNRRTNQDKLAWQTRARIAVSLAIFVLILNAVPAFVVQTNRIDVQNVEIKNWPVTESTKGKNNDRQAPTTVQPTKAVGTAPEAKAAANPTSP